jgi:YqaJ-like viral recombinase domain
MELNGSSMQHMLQSILEFLSQHPLTNTDDVSVEEWRVTCETCWDIQVEDYLTEHERKYSSRMLDIVLDSQIELAKCIEQTNKSSKWTLEQRKLSIQSLLIRPQIEQRTESWYLDALGLLSASQFSTILKSSRTRGQLVLEKAACTPIDTSARRTVVFTDDMTPFTWGIRFEPVVKQIYQHLTNTSVTDLGRLKHATDPRIAASPDGLIISGPDCRLGRFVEFKAPVTRPILNKVPEDYIIQMQIQMEVGNVEECDYLEVKFNSKYKELPLTDAPIDAKYTGIIHSIGDEEQKLLRYEYSPLMNMAWKPLLKENEQILESIPWWSSSWFLTTLPRSRSWFESVQPAVRAFWEDVEKAKQGTFVLPPSSRKAKEPVCKIVEEAVDQVLE